MLSLSELRPAMLWNQLNYITTVQVHDLIDLFRNALLGFLRVPLPRPPTSTTARLTSALMGHGSKSSCRALQAREA